MSREIENVLVEVMYHVDGGALYEAARNVGVDLDKMTEQEVGDFTTRHFSDISEVDWFGHVHRLDTAVVRGRD